MRHLLIAALIKLIKNGHSMPATGDTPDVVSLLEQFLQEKQIVLSVGLDHLHGLLVAILEGESTVSFLDAGVPSVHS